MGVFRVQYQAWRRLWKGVGIAMLVYGVLIIVGASMGSTDPFKPLSFWHISKAKSKFITVSRLFDMKRELLNAQKQSKPVLVDFYADWCVSCVKMEKDLFHNIKVMKALSSFVLIRADVTSNSDDSRAMMKYFDVVAPPTLLFFNTKSQEIKGLRAVGELDTTHFINRVKTIEGK
jgi:thiol:disulfide interchange protein DsbD